jgi:hypothetical protein
MPAVYAGPVRRPRRMGQGAGQVAAVGASDEIDRTPWGRRARRGARTAPRRVIPRAAATARVAGAWSMQAAASHNKICHRAIAIRLPCLTVRTWPGPCTSDFSACGRRASPSVKCRRTMSPLPPPISAAIHDAPWAPVGHDENLFGPRLWSQGARPSVLPVELRKPRLLAARARAADPLGRVHGWHMAGIASLAHGIGQGKRPEPVHWHTLAAGRTIPSRGSRPSRFTLQKTEKYPTCAVWTLRAWALGVRQTTAARRRTEGFTRDVRTTPQPPRDDPA